MLPAFLSSYYPSCCPSCYASGEANGNGAVAGKVSGAVSGVSHGVESASNGVRAAAPFFLMAGPCVIENEEMPFQIAEHIQNLCAGRGIPFVFKASYRKANRSREDSFQGIGDEKALGILAEIKRRYHLPIVTDIHTAEEAATAAAVADVLQIPAFLCRQTDLLHAAARTGRCVNIKKGQFLSPQAMQFAVEKVRRAASAAHVAADVMLTERGTTFGYQDLVVDFRSIPLMQACGVPVLTDLTHSLQEPNQSGGVTGGQPAMIETLAKAAIAVGSDGIFLETHPEPAKALSDGANMLPLARLEALLDKMCRIAEAVR